MNSRIRLLTVLGAVTAQTLIVQTARADQAGSVLIGKVTDRANGQPLQGVQVVVTSNSLQGEQTVETDSSGTYRLPNLPAGTYTVQFFMGGYKPFTSPQPVTLRANQTIRLNAPLQPEGAEEIEVIVEAPSVDVGSSSSGSVIDEEFIRKVPVVAPAAAPTKSFEAIAAATPGAQADTYGTSIAGATSPENGYKVDGISVGNPAFGTNGSGVSLEFLSEVQVISGGYMPEYGRSTGGTISATTRSGSNEFHGTVWVSASPGALEGKRKVVRSDRSAVVAEVDLAYIGDVGFVVDGPIIQDKLWFGAGVQLSQQKYNLTRSIQAQQYDDDGNALADEEGISIREVVPGTTNQFQAVATQLQAFGKLTYAINQDHRISVSGMYLPSWTGNQENYHIGILGGGGARNTANLAGDPDALGFSINNAATDVALHWIGSADNKRWTFDTSIALHNEKRDALPRDGSKIGSGSDLQESPGVAWGYLGPVNIADFEDIDGDECNPQMYPTPGDDGELGTDDDGTKTLLPCAAQPYITGGPGFVSERKMNRLQFRHNTGRTFQAAGHHTVKAGVDIEYMTYAHKKAYTGGSALRDYSSVGLGFADFRSYGVLYAPDQAVSTPYLDNKTSMQVYGAFLQDSWSIMDKVTLNAGVRYDAIFIDGSDGNRFISLPKQFAPRVGLIWDPTQKGKSKIFAQYARYYQGMSLNMADRAGSLEAGARTSHLAENCESLKDDPTATEACYASLDPGRVYGGYGGADSLGRSMRNKGANRSWGATGAAKTPVDPNLKPQSQDEVSGGVEYNILPNGKLALYYQKRWLNDIIEDVSRDEAHTYFIANPGSGIASDFPEAKRDYDAVQLVFTKTYSDHWLAQASYQWSHTRGNIAGLFRPESGQLDPNINSDFDLISLLPNRYGDLSTDRRHEIKIFAGGDYPIGERFALDGGLAFDARSGAPTNYLGTHALYGSGESFLLQRGSGERLPWQFNVNLNVGGVLKVGKSSRIKAGIEVFNLANFQATAAIDEVYALNEIMLPLVGETSKDALEADLEEKSEQLAEELEITPEEARERIENPNFGKATAYQAPRSFRFTLRFEF